MNRKPDPPHLGIHWMLDSGCGAGVLGINVVLQLCRLRTFRPVLLFPFGRLALDALAKRRLQWAVSYDGIKRIREQYPDKQIQVDFPILFSAGNDLSYTPSVTTTASRMTIIAFENTRFSPEALARRNTFDRIFTESSWNTNLLRRAGFSNVVSWTQGVDRSVFHPAPRRNLFPDRFVIFSGGKLEYRKAQDLVIAAFRIFHRTHPDALLLTAWANPWKQLINTLSRSPWVTPPPVQDQQEPDIPAWLEREGINRKNVLDVGYVPNILLAHVMRECDVAVFPNRAEGGTNLVAMECLAAGVPTILSANTGHLDLIETVPCYPLEDQAPVPNLAETYFTEGWGESSVDEIVARLEEVYQNRKAARQTGLQAAEAMEPWSWEHKVGQLAKDALNVCT